MPRAAEAAFVEPGSLRAWYVTIFLTLAFAVSFIERMIMALMVQPIKADLQLSDVQVSLLHGFAFVIFYVLAALPISRITDRGSRKLVIGASIAIWSIATAACGLSRSFWALFVSRIGVGIGEAGLSPASYSMIADYFPKEKLARPIAVYSLGIYAGSGLAFMIGGATVQHLTEIGRITLPVIGAIEPWQATFLAVALPGLLLLAMLATVREPTRRVTTARDEHRPSVGDVLGFIRRHAPFFACHFLGFGSMVVFMGASLAWVPAFFARRHGWTAAEIGTGYGLVFMIGGVLGVAACGALVDRLRRRGYVDAPLRLAACSAVLLIVPGTLATLLPTPELTLLLLVPAVFFYSIPIALAPTVLQTIAPARMRAQLAAIYLFVASLIGLAGGPTLTAFFTDFVFRDEADVGYSLAGVAGLMLPLAAALLWRGLRPYRALLDEASPMPTP